jgi:hypothetical protein
MRYGIKLAQFLAVKASSVDVFYSLRRNSSKPRTFMSLLINVITKAYFTESKRVKMSKLVFQI